MNPTLLHNIKLLRSYGEHPVSIAKILKTSYADVCDALDIQFCDTRSTTDMVKSSICNNLTSQWEASSTVKRMMPNHQLIANSTLSRAIDILLFEGRIGRKLEGVKTYISLDRSRTDLTWRQQTYVDLLTSEKCLSRDDISKKLNLAARSISAQLPLLCLPHGPIRRIIRREKGSGNRTSFYFLKGNEPNIDKHPSVAIIHQWVQNNSYHPMMSIGVAGEIAADARDYIYGNASRGIEEVIELKKKIEGLERRNKSLRSQVVKAHRLAIVLNRGVDGLSRSLKKQDKSIEWLMDEMEKLDKENVAA